MRPRGAPLLLAAALAVALAPARPRAEALPARPHALLLLRVLAYDRNVAKRAGPAISVVLLARAGDRGSEERASALHAALEEAAKQVVVAGLPVRAVVLAYRDAAELDARLEPLRPALLAVDEALEADVPAIARIARRRHALTAGTSRSMAEAGLAVSLAAGSARANLTVNLGAARAEGADLDAALLALSQVLREDGAQTVP